jgi:drug/metabolite transporter (DMT)-like permease
VAVLWALASALAYGLSDFVGGLVSRRAGFARVAVLGQLGGLIGTAIAAPLVSRTAPGAADLAWGVLSGVGTGVGMTFLFRGISRGPMSVVVPISAVGGVALPVVAGTAVLGQHPPPLTWAGIVLALPALWLVSGGTTGAPRGSRPAVGDGLVAGVGIAVQYLALAQAESASGIWPVTAGRAAAVLLVGVLARRLPEPGEDSRPPSRRYDAQAVLAGLLAALALVCYLLATRTQMLAVAVVLSSLYPVVPVVLGVTALRERLRPGQTAGLLAALTATVLIAAS